jgi:hypothetical protein
LELLSDLSEIQKAQPLKKANRVVDMQRVYELLYTSLMLKIDLKHAAAKVNVSALLRENRYRTTLSDQSLSDLSINTILLLSLSSKKTLC